MGFTKKQKITAGLLKKLKFRYFNNRQKVVSIACRSDG